MDTLSQQPLQTAKQPESAIPMPTNTPPVVEQQTPSKSKKGLFVLIGIIGVAIVVAGIAFLLLNQKKKKQEKNDNTNNSQTQTSNIVIGLSLATLRTERWAKDRDYIIEYAKEYGATVNVQNANDDPDLQLSQAENLIYQGVDVLIVVANDAEKAAPIIEKAHAQGIKVIAYDRMINNSDLDFYVSFDSEKVGEYEAQGVLNVAKTGKIAYIGGSDTDNNAHLLKEGSMKLLTPKIQSGDIQLVLDTFTPDWKQEIAYQTVKTYLTENKTIDGIIAANDGTAFGSIQALAEFHLDGKVPVSGQDAELTACQRIVEGTQTITVYKPLRIIAKKAVDVAISFVQKETPQSNKTMKNGKIDVPSFLLDVIPVTKDNMMDTIIKDGFYTFEDVYKNVPENERPVH